MEPDKRCRGARDENSNLVQEIVEGVEVPVCGEWDAGAEGAFVLRGSWGWCLRALYVGGRSGGGGHTAKNSKTSDSLMQMYE